MSGHSTLEGSSGCHDDQQDGHSRRDFLDLAAGTMGTVAVAAIAVPLIDTMNPAADTLALATTEVDVSKLAEGESMTVMWRGKPVFIRHRTAAQISEARDAKMDELKDPQTDQDRVKQSMFKGKEMPQYLVMVGVCTHLGCIPLGQKPTDNHGDFDGWFCPCHGSQYDSSGRIRKGPAPKNLDIPPYQFVDSGRIKIG